MGSSLLLTSNLGLRHLLIPNILQLQEQDKLAIVLPPTSSLLPEYKGFIHQGVHQTNQFLSQPFKCLGVSYYEFLDVVMSYPKRHLLYDDAIDAATLRLWLEL
jgi:hypothetical protein